MTHPQRGQRRDRGAVLPLVALVLPVLVLMTSFAVDLGRQRSSRRSMQAVADVVALDMARVINGRTLAEVDQDIATQQALSASAERNGAINATLSPSTSGQARITKIEWGILAVGTHIFSPLIASDPVQGTVVPTAVRITAEETTDYFFQPGDGPVSRSAVASLDDEALAEFTLGTTLVNITPTSSTIMGQILKSVIPGADLVGYQGLANATLTLGDLSTALGVGSVDQLMATTVTYQQLIVASAQALQAGGNPAAAGVLNQLVALGVSDFNVQLADVVGASTGGNSGADTAVSIPQLLLVGAGIADGQHTITIPGSVLNVPGLGDVTLQLTAIEAPVRIGTNEGAFGESKQMQVGMVINLATSSDKSQKLCELPSGERSVVGALLGGVFQLLNCLLQPLSAAALNAKVTGTVGLDMQLGRVTAAQPIICDSQNLAVDWHSYPGDVIASTDLSVNVTLGNKPLTLLGVSAPEGTLTASGASGTTPFTALDAGPRHTSFAPPTARVGAPNLGLANLLELGGMKVTVANTSLPVLGGVAKGLAQPAINTVMDQVDQLVVSEISKLFGLNLGGADITPSWMECEDNTVQLVG